MIKNRLIRNVVLAIFFVAPGAVRAAPAESPDRTKALQHIQRACEKKSLTPKILKERIGVCKCIVRNHAEHTQTADLKVIERVYEMEMKKDEALSMQDGLVSEFDMDIAKECLANSSYLLKK